MTARNFGRGENRAQTVLYQRGSMCNIALSKI